MNFQAIGHALEITEEAARKRLNRALEKLRGLLAKRGVNTSAAALSAVIAEAVHAAPADMAAVISATALAKSTLATSVTLNKVTAMTTLQKITISAALAATTALGIYEAWQVHAARAQLQALQQPPPPPATQIRQLQQERDDALSRVTEVLAESARLGSNPAQHEVLKLRGENSQLQTAARELEQVRANQASAEQMLLAQAKQRRLKVLDYQVKTLSDVLTLTPAQSSGVGDILSSALDASLQVTGEVLTGDPQKDVIIQKLNQIQADQEAKLLALLSPDQQSAYRQWESEQAAASARRFAQNEVASMTTYLDLPSEQVAAATAALASLPPRQDDGGALGVVTGQAELDLANEVAALGQVLTPAQLQTYEDRKQKDIATREAAVQMFKRVSK